MGVETIVIVGVLAALTSAITAILGFGGGIIMIAVLLMVVEPIVAIPLHAAIQVASNGSRAVVRRKDVDWRIVGWSSLLLLPAGALTLPLVRSAPEHVLQIAIALAVLAATWLPRQLDRPMRPPSRAGWVGLGGVFGALNPVVGATGPLAAPFLRAGTTDRMGFVGTFAVSQTIGHLVKIVLFAAVGLLPFAQAPLAAVGIAGVVVGTWVGSRILDRMSEHRFDRLYLLAITAVCLWLLVDALL